MTEAYPLHWPADWPRTKSWEKKYGRFKTSFGQARDELLAEIRRIGGTMPVISSNLPLRIDGLPYARTAGQRIDDAGVAVYFTMKGKQHAMACDRFFLPEDNLRAVCLSIESLRSLERYGASTIMERAFAGFAALPAPMQMKRHWSSVFEIKDEPENWVAQDVEYRFKELARLRHPDVGGSDDQMSELNQAREDALKEIAAR